MDTRLAKDLASSVANFYQNHGEAFSNTRHQYWDVFDVINQNLEENDVLIDVGAGNGRLQSYIDKKILYQGFEPSSTFRGQNPLIEAGSLPNIPVGDDTADLTTCLAVIHHIPGPDRIASIDELVRITKKGGIIIATAWNLNVNDYKKVADGDEGDIWINWSAEGAEAERYVHLFSEDEWAKLWTRPDLELIELGLDKKGLNRLVVARKI